MNIRIVAIRVEIVQRLHCRGPWGEIPTRTAYKSLVTGQRKKVQNHVVTEDISKPGTNVHFEVAFQYAGHNPMPGDVFYTDGNRSWFILCKLPRHYGMCRVNLSKQRIEEIKDEVLQAIALWSATHAD